jgi:peptidoglycan/xylan/chitin deacetylase (PgdA/CDA1 family)
VEVSAVKKLFSISLAVVLALGLGAVPSLIPSACADDGFPVTLKAAPNTANPTLTDAGWSAAAGAYSGPFPSVLISETPTRTVTAAGTHHLIFLTRGRHSWDGNCRSVTITVGAEGRIRVSNSGGELGPATGRARLSHIPGDPGRVTYISFGSETGIPAGQVLGQFTSLLPPDYGDVNGDGEINSADTTLLRRYIAAVDKPAFRDANPSFNLRNADVNGDGSINAADVTQLRRYIAAANPTAAMLGPPPQNWQYLMTLTFDDGPHPNWTLQILNNFRTLNNRPEVLSGEVARAVGSFYVNGSKVGPNAALVKRMVEEGHSVENHSWDHPNFSQINAAEARSQLTRTNNAILAATAGLTDFYGITHPNGVYPFSFRAPFFAWGSSLNGLDVEFNLGFHDSAIDTNDWTGKTAQQIANVVLFGDSGTPAYSGAAGGGGDGGIVLMHDDGGDGPLARQPTADSLALFIPQMQAMGYRFVTIRQHHELSDIDPRPYSSFTSGDRRPNQWVR